MPPPSGLTKKITGVLFIVILAAIAAQLVLNVVAPYVPIIFGLMCFIAMTGFFWRRMRRW